MSLNSLCYTTCETTSDAKLCFVCARHMDSDLMYKQCPWVKLSTCSTSKPKTMNSMNWTKRFLQQCNPEEVQPQDWRTIKLNRPKQNGEALTRQPKRITNCNAFWKFKWGWDGKWCYWRSQNQMKKGSFCKRQNKGCFHNTMCDLCILSLDWLSKINWPPLACHHSLLNQILHVCINWCNAKSFAFFVASSWRCVAQAHHMQQQLCVCMFKDYVFHIQSCFR